MTILRLQGAACHEGGPVSQNIDVVLDEFPDR